MCNMQADLYSASTYVPADDTVSAYYSLNKWNSSKKKHRMAACLKVGNEIAVFYSPNIPQNDNIPDLIGHYTNFLPCYWTGPYYRIWLFTLLREDSIEHFNGWGMPAEALTPPDFWSCPTFGLASVLI